MQMETPKPLQLKLHAISNQFDFKLNLRLKLSPPSPNPPKKSKSFKSRALRFLGKFQPRWSKFKRISVNQRASVQNPEAHVPANRPKQGKVAVGSIVVGLICLLCQFMYQKDSKWLILACGLITLLYMSFVLRKFTSRRVWDLLADVMVPILVCSIGVYVAKILKISHENVSHSVWKVVNYVGNLAPSSGNLRHLKYGLAHIEDILLRCVA